MSHAYSIYFTTRDGMFMGHWAIQSHFTRDKIEDIIKETYGAVFKKKFYELEDNYSAIEVNIWHRYWYLYEANEDIAKGVKHAVKNKLRMFLG